MLRHTRFGTVVVVARALDASVAALGQHDLSAVAPVAIEKRVLGTGARRGNPLEQRLVMAYATLKGKVKRRQAQKEICVRAAAVS